MLMLVLGLSALIQFFAVRYLRGDPVQFVVTAATWYGRYGTDDLHQHDPDSGWLRRRGRQPDRVIGVPSASACLVALRMESGASAIRFALATRSR
jgi:hypothetical protein